MNLKNNYLFKKLLKWANKISKKFNIYVVFYFLYFKNKEKHLEISSFYNSVPKILMTCSFSESLTD